MTVKRMDNVGIVVEDIDVAIEFFTELEGRAPIGGGRIVGPSPGVEVRESGVGVG